MGLAGAAVAEADKVFDWAVTKRLLRYLAPYGRNVRTALFGAMMTVIGYIAGPPLIGFAVDEGILKGNLHYVLLGVIAYLTIDGAAQLGVDGRGLLLQLVEAAAGGESRQHAANLE